MGGNQAGLAKSASRARPARSRMQSGMRPGSACVNSRSHLIVLSILDRVQRAFRDRRRWILEAGSEPEAARSKKGFVVSPKIEPTKVTSTSGRLHGTCRKELIMSQACQLDYRDGFIRLDRDGCDGSRPCGPEGASRSASSYRRGRQISFRSRTNGTPQGNPR